MGTLQDTVTVELNQHTCSFVEFAVVLVLEVASFSITILLCHVYTRADSKLSMTMFGYAWQLYSSIIAISTRISTTIACECSSFTLASFL